MVNSPPEGGARPTSSRSEGARTSLGFTLSQLGFENSRQFAEIVGTIGLEPRHFALLRAVREYQGDSQQAIAERLGVPASTMVALIDQLEGDGLLERVRHPTDRRTHTLQLTESGIEAVSRGFELGAQQERRICEGLSSAELAELMRPLGRVSDNLGIAPDTLPDAGSGHRPGPDRTIR